MSSIIETPFKAAPPAFSASRHFRICVPDEWYRRSKSRSNSSVSFTPSEDTVRRLADLQESEDEEEGDGTAKQKNSANSSKTPVAGPGSPGFTAPSDWRNSIAQNRLSSLFESWMHSGSPATSTTELPPEKKTVSEPKLISHNTGEAIARPTAGETRVDNDEDVDADEFEEMLVC